MDKRVDTFISGEQVPRSGVYRVGHRKHSIRDIKLLKMAAFHHALNAHPQFDLPWSLPYWLNRQESAFDSSCNPRQDWLVKHDEAIEQRINRRT
jgi:hypothetical protein